MEAQFEKLGAAIRTFRIHAASAKDVRSTFPNEDALLLSRIRELEIETNIAKTEDLILKTLCELGLEGPPTESQDESTSSNIKIAHYNSVVEMANVCKLPVKAASEAWALKQITESRSIFEDKSKDAKSDDHFDEIQKLMSLLGVTAGQLQELTETQRNQSVELIKARQEFIKEELNFVENLEAQRTELENKRNVDREANLELMQKINSKLEKVNTTRMLMNTILTISDLDLYEEKSYRKLLKLIRKPVTMDEL